MEHLMGNTIGNQTFIFPLDNKATDTWQLSDLFVNRMEQKPSAMFPPRSTHVPRIDVAWLKLRKRNCQETARPFAVLALCIPGDFACSAISYYVKQSNGLFDSCAPRWDCARKRELKNTSETCCVFILKGWKQHRTTGFFWWEGPQWVEKWQ